MALKDILTVEYAEEYLLAGNSACAGCVSELALRWALKALGPKRSWSRRPVVRTFTSVFGREPHPRFLSSIRPLPQAHPPPEGSWRDTRPSAKKISR